MATPADLWGEIAPSAVRTPVSILREQASLLGAKTKHIIVGQIDTRTSGKTFHHAFNLIVPALDNYSYELFEISHGVGFYPVRVELKSSYGELKNEEEFLEWLGQKLSSAETKRLLGNLLAQAKS
jgi:hypothetical protein